VSLLTRYLDERGINIRSLGAIGAEYSEDRIGYPRVQTSGQVGRKVRCLKTGKQWNSPGGVSHSETVPLMWRNGNARLIVCEGESDFLRLFGCDFDALCVPGSTAFPNQWADYVRGYSQVFVIPDGDEAGLKLVERVTELVPTARWVQLPDGEDVCSFLMKHSFGDLELLMERSVSHVFAKRRVRRSSFSFSGDAEKHRGKLLYYVVKDTRLHRRGGELVGCCPFHDEDTPSFMVNEQKGVFFCHGCRRGGDVVSYLREKGMGYGEAMRLLERG
jgi:DNA primase